MLEYIQIGLLALILGVLLNEYRTKTYSRSGENSVLLDTSVLIDGRIVEIAKAGFVPGRLVVPHFVVAELQLIADSNDAHKRERARFGLDVLMQLRTELRDLLSMTDKDYKSIRATDDKLVRLAKDTSALLCTMDFNLNKVAAVNGVKVLNINELAQAVRPAALPGEKHIIKIVQKGSSKDQGVGYLEDGTMVVVAGAGNAIGKKMEVSVTRMLQTEAGKMIFARKTTKR